MESEAKQTHSVGVKLRLGHVLVNGELLRDASCVPQTTVQTNVLLGLLMKMSLSVLVKRLPTGRCTTGRESKKTVETTRRVLSGVFKH